MISIPLLTTDNHDCSYLHGKSAKTAFIHPVFPLDTAVYSQLIQQGFRRSGNDVYRPQCDHCQACVPVRIPVTQFNPDRRQKRCLKKNILTSVIVKPARFEQKHYQIYSRYQQHRHADSAMAQSTADEYIKFLSSNWCQTQFAEIRLDKQPIGVATFDLLENALSAVYTFFDPDFSNLSPGTFAVLWQIEHARSLGLDYLYLGYWIKDCRKMRYKSQYQPLQGYINNQWLQLSP